MAYSDAAVEVDVLGRVTDAAAGGDLMPDVALKGTVKYGAGAGKLTAEEKQESETSFSGKLEERVAKACGASVAAEFRKKSAELMHVEWEGYAYLDPMEQTGRCCNGKKADRECSRWVVYKAYKTKVDASLSDEFLRKVSGEAGCEIPAAADVEAGFSVSKSGSSGASFESEGWNVVRTMPLKEVCGRY